MKVLALIFLSTVKFGLSTFGFYESKNCAFMGILTPSFNINLKFNHFRFYTDFSGDATITEDSTHFYWKFNQCYLKYQWEHLEIKGGKILFIPGFVGLFNPFFSQPAFETINTELEGEKGIFLRFTNEILTPAIYYTFKNNTSDILKGQLSRGISKFELGIYGEITNVLNVGGYIGYFGKQTVKVQGILKDSILKASANIEFPVKTTLLSLNYFHSNYPEITVIPASYMLTKNLLAVKIKFPDRIFEIPYLLCLLDIDNKMLTFLLDYRYILSNIFTLEAGFTVSTNETRTDYAIYGGLKLSKGF